MKRRGDKIVMITAYDAPSGRLADAAGVDLILVGDSSGMVMHGRESTVPVSLEEILFMTQWVTRARSGRSSWPTCRSARTRLERAGDRERGAAGERGRSRRGEARAERHVGRTGEAIVDAGIPVMGHIGLTPQTATVLGASRHRDARRPREGADSGRARAAGCGCFAIVLEAVPEAVARAATKALAVPTIGIGAGAATDGQVLVWHDMLGYSEGHAPRFVKRYAEIGDAIVDALGRYADDVRSGAFPEAQHTYAMPEEELKTFERR